MTISNKLTLGRIALVFVFIYFILSAGITSKITAMLVFLAASWTDYLDGYLAKKRNEITIFGKIMDPIADKILTLSCFIIFAVRDIIPLWMVIIIFARELLITFLRISSLIKGRVASSGQLGKQKTIAQMIAIFVILLYLIFQEGGSTMFPFWDSYLEFSTLKIIYKLMIATILLTVISGVFYVLRYGNRTAGEGV